jgi:hypothetical protein
MYRLKEIRVRIWIRVSIRVRVFVGVRVTVRARELEKGTFDKKISKQALTEKKI